MNEKGQIREGGFLIGKKVRDKGSEVGAGVGRLLGKNMGTDYETGPSVRIRENMWNTCLRLGVLVVSSVYVHVSKLGVSKRSVGRTLFGIPGWGDMHGSAISIRCDVRCKRTDGS